MTRPRRTVRLRLTIAVTTIVGVITIAAAFVLPRLVHSALVDDLLDAESAEIAADPLTPVGQAVSFFTADLDDDELTAFFGPEIGNLTAALDETSTIDELRSQRDDGQLLVVAAPDTVGIVADDGSVTVERVDLDEVGPVVTTAQLETIATDLDVDWFTLGPFELLLDGDESLFELFEDFEFPGDSSFFDDLAPLFDSDGPGSETFPFDLEELFDGGIVQLPDDIGSIPIPSGEDDHAEESIDLTYGIRDVDGVELIVAAPTESVDRSVERLTTILWLVAPILMLLVGLTTWMITSRALRPVRLITDRAASIRGNALHERVPVPESNDEITGLANEINNMLERLQVDDTRRRQFVSDASHELRSPIAAIQTQAEASLRSGDDQPTEELAAGVLAEAERMGIIVADLLSLARHDEGLAPPGTPFDLDDIVLAEAARARRVRVNTTAVSAGQVRGRPDEFTRVVAHLLDNAARHAHSEVAVTLRARDGRVVLQVDDDGPGIPAAERDHVLERFVRLDPARERDAGGAGLGLAVVSSVAKAAGGQVSIGDSPLGGARIEVDLPASS